MSQIKTYYKSIPPQALITMAFMLMVHITIAQLPAVSFQHIKRDIDLFASSFDALEEDQYGFIWFGSFGGGGLYRYDGYSVLPFLPDPVHSSTSLAGLKILDVYSGADGKIYVGTNFGFSIIDPISGKIKSINNKSGIDPGQDLAVTQSFLDDTVHRTLWIGTANGLARMGHAPEDSFQLLRSKVPAENKIIPENIVGILQDPQQPGMLWLGTSDGLFKYDIDKDLYTLIPGPYNSGVTMNIVEMNQGQSGNLWFIDINGSIVRYDTTNGQWKVYKLPVSDEVPDHLKWIVTVLPSGDEIAWVGNMSSVGKLNLKNGKYEGWSYNADKPEGLLPRGYYRDLLNDRHGRLWVSSWYGVQYARQAFMEPSGVATDLSVAITKVETSPMYEDSLTPLIYTGTLALRKNQRDITFQYVLPNPLNSTSVKYQYMLDGVDKDWITTDQRIVRYPRLKGGKYTFSVRARENDNQDWTKTTSLVITIPKQLIEWWWFWSIVGILFLACVILINRFLLSRAKKEERLKADFEHQLSEIQMQALRAQMNPHFLFNSLNSIKYFAISKSKDETAAYLSKFSMLVRAILNNSKSRTISLKEELDALQLYIEIEHLRLDGKFDYLIDIDSSIHIKQAQIPPMILQPFVENAIWHGLMHKDGRGKLLVQVKDMGHQIQCIIEDNGIGRAKAATFRNSQTDHKKSVGMQITSDRIALINKIYHIDTQVMVIDLEDENGTPKGTRVVINIPLIHDEEE